MILSKPCSELPVDRHVYVFDGTFTVRTDFLICYPNEFQLLHLRHSDGRIFLEIDSTDYLASLNVHVHVENTSLGTPM